LILQGKRLGLTLTEIREMLAARCARRLHQEPADQPHEMYRADQDAGGPAARY
jgi:DNA-binding transcriptional MerR regulator